jgi:hypothetical protein
MVISLNGRDFQRDAGMVLLEESKAGDHDPTIRDRTIIGAQRFTEDNQQINPLQEGEFIIVKDDPQATDWYCVEVRKVLVDRIEVNYYTTITPAIGRYTEANLNQKRKHLKDATFLRTWCLDKEIGLPKTAPPTTNHGKINHLWWVRIPLEDINRHVLLRGICLSALGKLDKDTIRQAAQLDIPHHEGAGGEENFVDKNAFQKHVRRVSNRSKRKRGQAS